MTLWDTASVSLGQVRLAVGEDLGLQVMDKLENCWRSGHVSAQKLVVAERRNAYLNHGNYSSFVFILIFELNSCSLPAPIFDF